MDQKRSKPSILYYNLIAIIIAIVLWVIFLLIGNDTNTSSSKPHKSKKKRSDISSTIDQLRDRQSTVSKI